MLIQLAPKTAVCLSGTVNEFLVGDGCGGDARLHQAAEKLPFPESAIEAIADFSQVALEVLVRDASVRPPEDRFGIQDDPIHPRQESCHVLRLPTDDWVMLNGFALRGLPVRTPPIGPNRVQKLPTFLHVSATAQLQQRCTYVPPLAVPVWAVPAWVLLILV